MSPFASDDQRMLEEIAARMKLRRKLLGHTQSDCAAALGLSLQQFQKYDAGRNWIGVPHLVRLARYLNVSLGYFFDDPGDEMGCEGTRHLHLLKAYEAAAPAVQERVDGLLGVKRERSPRLGHRQMETQFNVADTISGISLPRRRAIGAHQPGCHVECRSTSDVPVWEPADITGAAETPSEGLSAYVKEE